MLLTRSGVWPRHSVLPLWPACPPGFRPVLPRRLRVRRSAAGFFKPSLDGGWPLLRLFRPRRRSTPIPIRSRSQAFSNSRRAIFCPEVSDPGTLNGSNGSERLPRLTHFQTPASTPHQLRHPGQLPVLPLRLRVRRSAAGFFRPSLDGGWPLLRLAGRCCGCSDQDDAPTPLSAQQDARNLLPKPSGLQLQTRDLLTRCLGHGHLCHVAPRIRVAAALRPLWSSEITSLTPLSPRWTRLRRNEVQNGLRGADHAEHGR